MHEVVRSHKLDLLHVHYAIPHATSAWIAKEMLRKDGEDITVITTLHGTDITLVGQDRSYYPITRFSIEKSDRITAVSVFLKRETIALYLACRDPRTPWYAKAFAAVVVAYALSPIDLIPDFVPILGYLDDLILVPLGLALAVKMIPDSVMAECREQARLVADRPTNQLAAAAIVGIWLGAAVWATYLLAKAMNLI